VRTSLGLTASGLARTFVVPRIAGRSSVVGSSRVVVSADEAAEVANTNQFFNLVLECFAFFCGVAVVSVIAAIFSHVYVWGSGRLAWWWDEIGL